MNKLRCIVADDEPIARQILQSYIEETPNLKLLASCKNAFEVMELLQQDQVDILFLDINMPKLTGLSLLKTLRQKPNVIITTAYPEYAVEGFELSVTDYLLKPFSLERFLQAVSKIPKPQKSDRSQNDPQNIIREGAIKSIFVKSNKKIIKVNFKDISHVEAYGNYIKIHTDKMILTPQTLSEFLNKLPDTFIRIHKSFIINFDSLKLIDGNQIVLYDDTKLPIGKSYRNHILERISTK